MTVEGPLFSLARQLLAQTKWSGRSEVARAMQVHRASIQSWLDHLAHHRAIDERRNLVVDTSRLWQVLTAHRITNQRPHTSFDTPHDVEEIHSILETANIPHAFCMFSAANQFAFYEPRQQDQIYIPRLHAPHARKILDATSGSRLQVFHETVTLDAPEFRSGYRNGIRVTDPILTIADLRAHPEGGAHANFLETNYLPRFLR